MSFSIFPTRPGTEGLVALLVTAANIGRSGVALNDDGSWEASGYCLCSGDGEVCGCSDGGDSGL